MNGKERYKKRFGKFSWLELILNIILGMLTMLLYQILNIFIFSLRAITRSIRKNWMYIPIFLIILIMLSVIALVLMDQGYTERYNPDCECDGEIIDIERGEYRCNDVWGCKSCKEPNGTIRNVDSSNMACWWD